MTKECIVNGCDKEASVRELCKSHHHKWWRLSNPRNFFGLSNQNYRNPQVTHCPRCYNPNIKKGIVKTFHYCTKCNYGWKDMHVRPELEDGS